MLEREIEEGTVLEMTVTRPGEEPVRASIKVQTSDLELLRGLKEMSENGGV